ncbi:PTS transporter subunit IIC [Oscillibacter sp.]|uniref:PTS transporter subunit IIC n=1 Tax=Oscillibacter sp. TaxID=1945593 RepID=UPI00261B9003|nr:PTS sugar transporter subunit IIC [Oscillibacter sp.]MDD3347097.1 PTS sugar transporter subunit IIC [Oscillibacter sp.]
MENVKTFLARKNIELSAKRYGIDALGAMAQGLFCSLLIGTIIKTLGQQTGISLLTDIGTYAMSVSGPAMAIAIGYALKADPMVLFSLAAVGWAANAEGGAGGPLAVLLIAIIAAECGKAVSKETRVDILVTPAVTILVGVTLAKLIAPPIGAAAGAFGLVIDNATKLQPFWMGIAVSVLVGVALTLPISSAAICSVLQLTGLAGGAAVAGCCAQMVGFAVMSFRENRWGGLVSQGLGTSMLQMPNIVRNPRVWIAPTVASAITGPIATCLFKLEMNGAPINSGMGTCGLCGQIGVWTGWLAPSEEALAKGAAAITPGAFQWLGLLLICFVLPAILAPLINRFCRHLGWVKDGDLTLD